MQLIVIALLIIQGALCHWIGFSGDAYCSDSSINHIRDKYLREVYEELEDLADLKKAFVSCTREVQDSLNRLRSDIENARPSNDQTINQCLDELVVRANNVECSYKDVLNTECYSNIEGTISDLIQPVKEASLKIENCVKIPGSCRSITKCCERVEDDLDDADIEDEVEDLARKYKRCVRNECGNIKGDIHKISAAIGTCSQLTTAAPQTEAPAVTTEAPQPPQTEGPVVTTGAPQPPQTEVPVVTTEAPQPPQTELPAVTTEAPQPPQTEGPVVTTGAPQPPQTEVPAVTTEAPQPPQTEGPVVTTGAPQPPQTEVPVVTTEAPQPPQTEVPAVTTGAPQPPQTELPAVTTEAPQPPQTETPVPPTEEPVSHETEIVPTGTPQA